MEIGSKNVSDGGLTVENKKNKAHRHKYEKVVEWITSPSSQDDAQRFWCFTVMRACECGATYKSESELSEVEEFIKESTCSSCGAFGSKHTTHSDCIRDLQLRVRLLEDTLHKTCDALSGIGR